MSAADCILGPLARAAREWGVVEVWWCGKGYRAATDRVMGVGRAAQEACDNLERALDSPESAKFDGRRSVALPAPPDLNHLAPLPGGSREWSEGAVGGVHPLVLAMAVRTVRIRSL